MFGWFRSKAECPIDAQTRAWLDGRWTWLENEFGLERLGSTRVILPRAEFFPDPFRGTEEDARTMLDRVCVYMDIEPETVEFSLYEGQRYVYEGRFETGTAGLYCEEDGKFRIWLAVTNLDDAHATVATFAHELGHVHLLGHGRISQDVEDHEPLTDLLTVFFGLGVFTANSVVRERYWNSEWSIGSHGYLTMPVFGYAMARFALARGDDGSAWFRELRPDVRAPFMQSMRLLSQRDGSSATPRAD